ncbi:Uncharacterized protein conserved in bacteria [Kingella potus]|uniref:Uncharacterized protein conserved in bacteria n=1 Tax=Kingella potus TaxID=265175 RepID=A0A377R1M9_9NEIS|nr:DUF1697 domain-containing protein [Kingella potus]UOP01196.1 DUF1697 domain-containing protein [Kingella potus]STR00900.1 Uncharacterized protein conserved in bacteria [Kingella potus]
MSSPTLIAFLRGVMPRGKNAVRMADIRTVLGGGGFGNVRTWIQSGNIALESPWAADETAARIHGLLHGNLNANLVVVVKTPEQLREILDGNPFAGSAYDPKRVFYTLCNTPLADTAGLGGQDFGAEKLHIRPCAAYSYIPQDASRSKLGNAFLEKQLGLRLTTRNGNTLRKMADF